MEPFIRHTGRIAILNDDHIDTDRIIPARFLSRVTRMGYGELLFADVRTEGFVLDQEAARGASILVAGTNFGCGSSREHAVWALQQAGFRAVIARIAEATKGFSDIFRQNAANCGLLLIELGDADHGAVVDLGTGAEITIDLEGQRIETANGTFGFEIAVASKLAILQGLDLIGTTLVFDDAIRAYEQASVAFVPPAAS
ncbi:MAG: 3-isopropylmalate dehydratase small subunit [Fimbriimonas sp.]